MGRQINFYMEENAYKQIVEKALSMGFVILREECVGGKPGACEYQYHWYETMPDIPFTERHYFYNPSCAGFRNQLDDKEHLTWNEIKERKLFLISMFAPMIEAACSYISDDDKFIAKNRLYVETGFYDAQSMYIKQDESFMKQYSALERAVKKLAVKRELPCKPPYSDCTRKVYVTDYLFSLYQDGYELR